MTVYVIAASVLCLTTSTSAKRTSTRPSGSGCIEPTTTASALRARQTSAWTSSARDGRGLTLSVPISLNMPERPRSAPTMPDTPSGNAGFAAEGNDRDRDGGPGAADDFDGQLRAGGSERKNEERDEGKPEAERAVHAGFLVWANRAFARAPTDDARAATTRRL